MERARAVAVKVRWFDEELGVTVVRTIGYRAMVGDEPVGDLRRFFAVARADARAHNRGQRRKD